MSDPHVKRFPLLIGVLLAILAGSLYLFARPSAPALVPPTPAPAGASSPAQSASTSSTQPKITWSQNEVEVILAPTESASSDLTFSSSLDLQNAVVEAVPGIAGLLTVQPNGFANASAGSSNAVHVSFSIPSGTAFGAYNGTIHVRVGSSTLPQTLKILVDVWPEIKDPITGLGFRVPPFGVANRLLVNTSTPNQAFVNFQLQDDPQSFVSEFGLRIYANPAHLGLSDWFEQNIDLNGILAANQTFKDAQLVDGSHGLVFSGPMPAEYLDVGTPIDYAFRLSPDGNQVISITQSQANSLFDRGYSQDAISNLEVQVLGTVHF